MIECIYCSNLVAISNPSQMCESCCAREEAIQNSFFDDQSCDDDGGDGYAAGGWDDGREAFNDPCHFEG